MEEKEKVEGKMNWRRKIGGVGEVEEENWRGRRSEGGKWVENGKWRGGYRKGIRSG